MITVRKSGDRGHFNHGWLDTYHTFSFSSYYDPQQMGFRSLRVINEDTVAPRQGFGTHGHRDMEIVTLVLSGALEHRDNLGHGEVVRHGELQQMTAGSGIEHSEFNPSSTEPVHLYQIWLRPEAPGLAPGYGQRAFDPADRQGAWQLVVSRDGRQGSLSIHQDADLYLARLAVGQELTLALREGRHAWLQVLSGQVQLAGHALAAGDGAAVSAEKALSLVGTEASEVLLFDLV